MLARVPLGKSRLGCGTVTRPGLVGCLNWQWEPRRETSCQPSRIRTLMTSLLFIQFNTMRIDTHAIRTTKKAAGFAPAA